MREMKDSGIEWIGEIPADWTLQRGKTIFAQRLTKGNQSEILLAATQKYGMLPQSEVHSMRGYVPLHIRCFTIQIQFVIIIIGFCLNLMVLFKR